MNRSELWHMAGAIDESTINIVVVIIIIIIIDWSKFKSLWNHYHYLILLPKSNITPNWSFHHPIIHGVSGKLSINS